MLACLDLDKVKLRLLDSHEWAILPALIHLLKIFADVVNFCKREDSCISEAIPNAKSLMFNLERAESSGLSSFKEELKSNMRKNFYGADARQQCTCIEENPLYAVATVLDLRFKKKAFLSLEAADQAEIMLVRLTCSKVGEVSTRKSKGEQCDVEQPNSKPAEKYQKTFCGSIAPHLTVLDDNTTCALESDSSQVEERNPYEQAKQLVGNYFTQAKCSYTPNNNCALHFWKTQCQVFPQLAEIALQYLSASISSVASEREFKVARDLANGNRTRLKPANV